MLQPECPLLHDVTELERQAAVPETVRLKMSEPDSQYVVYMLDKYGDDYKVSLNYRTPASYSSLTPISVCVFHLTHNNVSPIVYTYMYIVLLDH